MLRLACLVLASFASASSHADLSQLIAGNSGRRAVVVPVAESPDQGYGLLVMTDAEFAERMEEPKAGVLENPYLKVVENGGSEPISSSDFDGENTLYHLMQARAYFLKLAGAQGGNALGKQVTVRVRVTHFYNPATHFTAWKAFNESAYIPAESKLFRMAHPEVQAWGNEIWFFSRKGELEMNKSDWAALGIGSGISAVSGRWGLLPVTIPLDLFQHYNGGLDSAKIPSVIYHEAFHWATDTAGLIPATGTGNPVAEDYANYFASSIIGRPEIAEIDEFSSRYYKRKYDRIREVKDARPAFYNADPFGPSIFWKVRNELGQERADRLIWDSIAELNGSFRHTEVPKAVLTAARRNLSISASELAALERLFGRYEGSYVNLQQKYSE